MEHLLEISQLTKESAQTLVRMALEFKHNLNLKENFVKHTVANLFYENSTRTRVSFEMAAKYLQMPVVNLDLARSSETKGEMLYDTVQTLEAMGVSVLVIRHKEENVPQILAQQAKTIHIINAGDGQHAHPSQALLDLMTIIEKKPQLEKLKVAVIGDIRHSRVANSFQCISELMNIGELVLICPKIWQPTYLHYGHLTDNLRDGIADADVIITLRIQHERIKIDEEFDINEYKNNFTLNSKNIMFAKPDAIIMHPGPVNRNIEITPDVMDSPQSMILRQVKNGVYMRMAILKTLIEE